MAEIETLKVLSFMLHRRQGGEWLGEGSQCMSARLLAFAYMHLARIVKGGSFGVGDVTKWPCGFESPTIWTSMRSMLQVGDVTEVHGGRRCWCQACREMNRYRMVLSSERAG
jgi:hypothetical protein